MCVAHEDRIRTFHRHTCVLLLAVLSGLVPVRAQETAVTGRIVLVDPSARGRPADNSNAAVWLTAVSASVAPTLPVSGVPPHRFWLKQENKSFKPHVLIVPAGSVVEFPNLDPFFHNVFSLFDGKRFDLGLYEAGKTKTVNFNSPGICYIFCNIHPQMSAVVVVVKTPYYGLSDSAGNVRIPSVPPGLYRLNVFYERCLPETLKSAAHDVAVSDTSRSFGEIRLTESADVLKDHKNKYGRDYDTSTQSDLPYDRP